MNTSIEKKFSGVEARQGLLISFLAFGYVLLEVFPVGTVKVVVSLVIIGVIFLVLPRTQGSLMIISFTLLIIGIIFMTMNQASIEEWLNAARINLTLVAIFLFTPLLGIPVRTGGYIESLKMVVSKGMNNPNYFFAGSSLLTHFLGVVLNIGSISIVYEISKASNINNNRLVAAGINRGFVSAIFWSPYFSAMALILSSFPIKWGDILIYSLGLSFIAILLSYVCEQPYKIKLVPPRERIHEDAEMRKAKKKVGELFFLLFLMVSGVLIVEKMTSLNMTLIICLISAFLPISWCLLKGERESYRQEFKTHIFVGIPRMKKEIVLFLISGFFSGAFVKTGWSVHIIDGLNAVSAHMDLMIAYIITISIVSMSIMGLHPIVLVTILATSIDPLKLGYSYEFFAILLLSGWGISNTISPATTVNNLLSALLKEDLLKVSVRWNLLFVMFMLLIIPIYLKLVGI
ncbi:hypothetical protein AM500_18730 [Bacillus sp. FJAT-18017]|uniref:hypothetical protein n=1 Tax=Bacillus sp. FJAT-18017 TaxID=1705566 RepID=UPI0006ADB67C|nr:hypothetical protein [Bacillus sp. FJAT-18017]ALC91591.1 hypothetical protein AM500_18730 [Bacillus sp. FJAT-18017]